MKDEDWADLEAAVQGEEAALVRLYEKHRGFVFNLARRFTQNPDDAADVLQEVFSHLCRKAPALRLNCALRTWLYAVTRNRSIDLLRKKWRRQHEGLSGQEVASEGAPCDDSASLIAELSAGLDEAQRELIALRFRDEMSLEEIAVRLEIPLGTVKSRLHYALALLRRRNPMALLLLMALDEAAQAARSC
ncbi:MAG: hypothetical protein RL095_3526 [Verrucomicrobiota bacterium]|jgi:RNA polymerase sigma-70 factor (ECF subfamily)